MHGRAVTLQAAAHPVCADAVHLSARTEEAVAEQAALVRALKEEHGLANDDEEVLDHVAQLLRRKAKLEKLQQRAAAADAAPQEALSGPQEAPA